MSLWLWIPLALGLAAALLVVWMTAMPGHSHSATLPPLTDREASVRNALRSHVQELAGEIGERNLWNPDAYQAAEHYIATALQMAGYPVRTQQVPGDGYTPVNLEVELRGKHHPNQILVVGAHYDTVLGSPGANDNGSGVAALLVLAQRLAGSSVGLTVRLVAFANEEAPFFNLSRMGSQVWAAEAQRRGEQIVGMFSLETIGYYDDVPGSQQYPAGLSLLYPDAGNFLAFVGNLRSSTLVRHAMAAFRRHATLPSEGIAAPSFIPGVSLSDHRSFWERGYAALMVTDTAPFRYPHYHAPTDTSEQLDYDRTARAVVGLEGMLRELAGERR